MKLIKLTHHLGDELWVNPSNITQVVREKNDHAITHVYFNTAKPANYVDVTEEPSRIANLVESAQ